MNATPTPLDVQWLREQIAAALAGTDEAISLPRATVHLIACVLDSGPAAVNRYNISAEELRVAVLAELRRLASNSYAPSKHYWNVARQRNLPTAPHICRVLDTRWPALVAAAGLRLSPRARRYGHDDSGELPAEIADEPPVLTEDDYDAFETIGRRTEIQMCGNIRITRTYHTLR